MATTRKPLPDWLPYVLPMALFLGMTFVEGQFPAQYIWIYFAKIVAVSAALVWARGTWSDIQWQPKLIPLALAAGLLLFAVWVGVEKFVQYPHLGDRTAYDPWSKIPEPGLRGAFLAVRFFGIALLVPFMEELFWRSFLLRYATRPDFKSLAIGTFSMNAALLVCGLFALSHPEWIPALIFGGAMALLLWKTKSVFACFVAHAATNLALAIYVVTQREWALW